MPYLKEEGESPQGIKRIDVPFNKIEMCMIFLHAEPFGLLTTYWATKCVGHFTTSTKALINDLVLLEPNYVRMQKLSQQVQGFRKKNGKASGNNVMAFITDVIPNKDKKGDKGSQCSKPNPKTKGKRMCEHCDKWACPIMHTHIMDQCHAWDTNGRNIHKPGGDLKKDMTNLA